MRYSWKLGSAFGIGIYIHWSFLLLPAWVLVSNLGSGLGLAVLLMTLLLTVFGCVVLHELGHALMARYFGIATHDITLYPIGGVARLERMSERPLEEVCIALAGPAVNMVLSVLLLALLVAFGAGTSLAAASPAWAYGDSFLFQLLLANVMLVLFNLIPAFPMDGGRVLRALLALRYDRLKATTIAARVAVGMAILMATAALVFHIPTLILVAGLVFFMGQQELAAIRRQELEPLEVLPADDLIGENQPAAFSGWLWNRQLHVWIMWRNGHPIAYRGEAD